MSSRKATPKFLQMKKLETLPSWTCFMDVPSRCPRSWSFHSWQRWKGGAALSVCTVASLWNSEDLPSITLPSLIRVHTITYAGNRVVSSTTARVPSFLISSLSLSLNLSQTKFSPFVNSCRQLRSSENGLGIHEYMRYSLCYLTYLTRLDYKSSHLQSPLHCRNSGFTTRI